MKATIKWEIIEWCSFAHADVKLACICVCVCVWMAFLGMKQKQAQLKCDIMLNVSMFSFLISFVWLLEYYIFVPARQHIHTHSVENSRSWGDNLCALICVPQNSSNHSEKCNIPSLTFFYLYVCIFEKATRCLENKNPCFGGKSYSENWFYL